MQFEQFSKSIEEGHVPETLNQHALSLWHDARGDWETAHTIIQDIEDTTAAWIHAYLHRKEGDISNAGYWYRRAGRKIPSCSLEKEWEEIARDVLG